MKKLLINFAEWFVIIVAGSILAYLTLLVLRFSFNAENSIPIKENILWSLLSFTAVAVIIKLIGHFLNPHQKTCRILTVVCFVFTFIFVGVVTWSFVSEALLLLSSDESACHNLAMRFYQSDFGAVVPKDSYLSLWPFQTGFIFILEKIMRIFHSTDPLLFQKINCGYVLMLLTSGYVIVCSVSRKMEGRILYLFLMATYWPLIFRVKNVYGDLPALAWIMFSGMCYLFFNKTEEKWKKVIWAILFSGSTFIACLYKNNSLIFVIAILLVSVIQQIRKTNLFFGGVVIITVVLSMFSTSFTQKYYEFYAGNVCGKGVPAIAYIAMGLQYNGENAMGGWNGFHSNTYIETGYDYELTAEISRASIRESLENFTEDPGFMLHFFHNKILSQWANQTHAVYWDVHNIYDTTRNSEDFWVKYLETKQYEKWLDFEDEHENVIYIILFLSVCVLLRAKIKKQNINWVFLLPYVTFIGGFLFSLIWEAQTDAVIYYPVFALPTAIGILFSDNAFTEKEDYNPLLSSTACK